MLRLCAHVCQRRHRYGRPCVRRRGGIICGAYRRLKSSRGVYNSRMIESIEPRALIGRRAAGCPACPMNPLWHLSVWCDLWYLVYSNTPKRVVSESPLCETPTLIGENPVPHCYIMREVNGQLPTACVVMSLPPPPLLYGYDENRQHYHPLTPTPHVLSKT